MPEIVFDRAKLNALMAAYKKAQEEKAEVFTFEGHDLYVPYAKHLISFLTGKLVAGTPIRKKWWEIPE